jgi:hypothetical protein
MAQRGTLIGLALWLALGCGSRDPEPHDSGGQGSAAIGGGGAGGAGAGGAGIGGAGAGGTGGDAAGQACMNVAQPGVYACVTGDGIPFPGSGQIDVDVTGTVERAATDAALCVTLAGSRTFGYVGAEREQAYVVRDGETEISLTLRTGSARPLLAVGQRVHITVEDMPSGSIFLSDTIVLSVRDDADERILYWFAQTERGLEELPLPAGLGAANAELQCMYGGCGTNYRRGLALRDGSGEVMLELGELGELGEYAALLIDNTERVLTDVCFDASSFHKISVALFARDLVSKCDWLDESACSGTDGCRDVRAYVAGNTSLAPAFIACVEEDSCGDGDAETCAIDDVTELPARFTTTCVPPGWTIAHDACDLDADGGSP